MIKRSIGPLLLALTLAACAGGGSDIAPTSGKLEQMAIGQARQVGSSDVSVTLQKVEDSRCPASAVCIRAGEAVVTLDVAQNGAHDTLRLGEDAPTPRTGTARGREFTLVAVTPFPGSGPAPAEVYRVDLSWRQP